MFDRKMKQKIFQATTNPEISQRELRNRKKAAEAAAEGMVLLKNEGHMLPLRPGCKVAMFGRGVRKTVKGGTGSGSVNERSIVTLYDGMKNAGFVVTTDAWLDAYDEAYEEANRAWQAEIQRKSKEMWSFDAFCATPFAAPVGDLPMKTDTDTAIVVISRIAGENADRRAVKGDYYLSDGERELIRRVCALYRDVLLVINAGGQVDLSVAEEFSQIRSVLILGMPGMEGGTAFADILLGRITPSGKLTDTWAYRYEDYPSADSFSHNDGNMFMEYYREGIYVGYRYFDTFDIPARYGFGFGLSYTTFLLDAPEMSADDKNVSVRVEVTNTGSRYAGKEVVQIYATCPCGRLSKEYRRLVGFAKTGVLEPGASETVRICFPLEDLASYDDGEPGWVLESGSYYLWMGSSLAQARLVGELTLADPAVLVKTENQCCRLAVMKEMQPDAVADAEKRAACAAAAGRLGIAPIALAPGETKVIVYHTNVELANPDAMDFVNTLTVEQLLRLANGELRADGTRTTIAGEHTVPGACGETSRCARENGLPSIIMADGPAGLRLTSSYREKDGRLLPTASRLIYSAGAMVTPPDNTEPAPGEIKHYQYCTAIPTGTQLAQSWNVELARALGDLVAGEMEEFGVTIWLAPGMNIHRNPLCGRNFEYFSEDPILTGKMAAGITRGVQAHPGCMTMIKHFACNNQEDNRHFSNSIVSQRPLREIYLKGFQVAIRESAPLSLMSSYNMLNGVHAANSFDLCSNILRSEWGFRGFVATDWRTTVHDGSCTAANCMRAGNDLNMPGFEADLRNLQKELRQGTLHIEDVKACVSRLVSVIRQSNQYE